MAATQRSEDDVRRLGRILDSVEDRLTEVHLFSEGDRKFHLAIAEATGNSVLVGMMSFVHELMGQGLWLTLMRDTHFATPGRWQQAWQEHRGIHEAIKAGSGQLATDRMRAHLERVEQVMIEADLVHLGRSSR
jgi:DNA-binding FadR family transcriptional regulator